MDEKRGVLIPVEGAAPDSRDIGLARASRSRPLDPAQDAFTREVLERGNL